MKLLDIAETLLVKPLMFGSKTELVGDRFHLQMPSHGIGFVADFDGRVSTIFFYSEGMDGYREFSGSLPEGISFRESQSVIHRRLGQPSASGGGKAVQFLGNTRKWDRYDREVFSLHIQYGDDENSISLISLMRG